MNNINFQTKIILQTLFKHTDCIDRVVIFFFNYRGKASFTCCNYRSNCNEDNVEVMKEKQVEYEEEQKKSELANSGSQVSSKMFKAFTAYVLTMLFFWVLVRLWQSLFFSKLQLLIVVLLFITVRAYETEYYWDFVLLLPKTHV